MKTKVDFSRYESMYDTFDKGHDRQHMEGVRKFALKLAEKYCPDKIEVVYVSATLHDIGLSISREEHERHGYEIIKEDKNIKDAYSEENFNLILEGIREHRASSGHPTSTVAKIVSDADKAYGDMYVNFKRAYEYNLQKDPKAKHNEILRRAAAHLNLKFNNGGTGTRLYFEESSKRVLGNYKPIIQAYERKDYKRMEEILNYQN